MAEYLTRFVVFGALIVGSSEHAVAQDSAARAPCSFQEMMPEHIRTTSCEMVRAITVGMSTSPRFRRLVEHVAELHGIVYVIGRQVVQTETRRVIDGALQHRVTIAGSHRLFYVTVTPYSGVRPVPIIAHELQHVIEVLESNATSEQEIDDLFERIGVRTGARTMETAAARAAELAVAKEVSRQK